MSISVKHYSLATCTLLMLFLNIAFSQNSTASNSKLEDAGINTALLNIKISSNDIEKILAFDFSRYRNYNRTQEVQLEDGPIITLYSIEYLMNKGVVFSETYIESKKDVVYSESFHPVIPLVNIGFGKINAPSYH